MQDLTALRNQTAISLLVLDVDHFKDHNDALGHSAGDRCLANVGRVLQRFSRRPCNLAARLGGDEFASPGCRSVCGCASAAQRARMEKVLAGILAVAAAVAPVCAMSSPGDHAEREAQAIAAAERADVHELDAALPRQPLETWLAGVVGARGAIRWEMNDCGEQTGNPANTPADFPICAEAMIVLPDGQAAGLSLAVGTAQKGVFGQPAVWFMFVTAKGRPSQSPRRLEEFSRLITGR